MRTIPRWEGNLTEIPGSVWVQLRIMLWPVDRTLARSLPVPEAWAQHYPVRGRAEPAPPELVPPAPPDEAPLAD